MPSQPRPAATDAPLVDDTHSQLNPPRFAAGVEVTMLVDIVATIVGAAAGELSVAFAGRKHAMDGRQFCEASVLLDMRVCLRVLAFDLDRGLVTAKAA